MAMEVVLVFLVLGAFINSVICFKSPYPDNFTYTEASLQEFRGIYYLLISQKKYLEISQSSDLQEWSHPQKLVFYSQKDESYEYFWNIDFYISSEGKFLIYFKNFFTIDVGISDTFLGPYNVSTIKDGPEDFHPKVLKTESGLVIYYQTRTAVKRYQKGHYLEEDGLSIASDDYEEEHIYFHGFGHRSYSLSIRSYHVFQKDDFFYFIVGGLVKNHFSVTRSEDIMGPFTGNFTLKTNGEYPKIFDIFYDHSIEHIRILYSAGDQGLTSLVLNWENASWPEVADISETLNPTNGYGTFPNESRHDIKKLMDIAEKHFIFSLVALIVAVTVLILFILFTGFQLWNKQRGVKEFKPVIAYTNQIN